MKKIMDHKYTAQLAINILCDLTKKHCSMCEWEQDCSDNPLQLDSTFACQYVTEKHSWVINKQLLCAKCKLQLGEHLLDHQAQNTTRQMKISEKRTINCQCHHYKCVNENNSMTDYLFGDLESKDLIKLQETLCASANNTQN